MCFIKFQNIDCLFFDFLSCKTCFVNISEFKLFTDLFILKGKVFFFQLNKDDLK